MTDLGRLDIAVGLNTDGLRRDMQDISSLAQRFGRTMTSAFAGAISGGKSFSSVLRSLALSLSRQALSAALRPIGNLIGSATSGLFAGGSGFTAGARSLSGPVTPFAKGGVVTSPTVFPMPGGLGMMGERGAEAIMPLARGPDGTLGVKAGGAGPVSVTVNITTPDVAGFTRSRGQIAAQLAQAMSLGRRNLKDKLWMTASFHEVRFPTGISRGATGGPERRTEIVVLGSGHEERNNRWSQSRRKFNAGYGIRSIDEIHQVVAFFEARRGRLYGFRWKDHADDRSGLPSSPVTSTDQVIGTGDGSTDGFQLVKTYGDPALPYTRTITKPVTGTLAVAVDGAEQVLDTDFTADLTTGQITFLPGAIPASGDEITAGYEFDVPVRFDTDLLEISLTAFQAGQIVDIPIVEVRS